MVRCDASEVKQLQNHPHTGYVNDHKVWAGLAEPKDPVDKWGHL